MSIFIRFIFLTCLLLGILSEGWAFSTEGVINADFSYRNLRLIDDPGMHSLSGLLKNRSDRAHLGILVVFRAQDCVTGRTKWKAPLFIDSIDPQVEVPFKIQLPAHSPGYFCKFSFRTGYHILPIKPGPVFKKELSPTSTPDQPESMATADQVLYARMDGEGVIHYSTLPPESGPPAGPDSEDGSGEGPIYSWIDRQGVTRYSDTPPEPRALLEQHQYAMQSADSIEAYTTAMRKLVWANWVHPPKAPQEGKAFKAIVRFYILPDGRIRKIRIENSSGMDALDESFYNAVAKSDPLPPLPARFKSAFYDAQVAFTSKGVE